MERNERAADNDEETEGDPCTHEEHQLGPGEQISMGITQKLFDTVCAGCHGSISSHELDVGVSADALTGASASASSASDPVPIGP